MSAGGVTASDKLIQVISQCPRPANQTEVRAFVGMTNYYRDLIPHYSDLAAPLTDLTGKNRKFVWSDQCERAFIELKRLMTCTPVLSHPDFSRHFTLHCDASATALGGVLTQVDDNGHEHPIRYMSKKLSSAQRNYTVGELECLAVVECIRACKSYLNATEFTVVTDHRPLLHDLCAGLLSSSNTILP